MINEAAEKGFVVSVVTNAAALHRRMIEALLESGLHRLQISLDTVFPETFESLVGGKVKFEVVWRNFLEFLYEARIKRQKDIFITVSAVLVKEVKEVLPFLRWFWGRLPVDNFYEGPLLTLQVYSGRYKETLQEAETKPWRPCVNPWSIALVRWDGATSICPQDMLNLWSVGKVGPSSSLAEVFNSQRAFDLREALLKRNIAFFEKCGYYCHRCNAWHPDVQHAVEDWLDGYLQLLSGLTLAETALKRIYPPETLEFLEYLYANRDRFPEILTDLRREYEASEGT